MADRELDLNLLRILVALDRTRNVSRAAAMLGMSQPGFSSALARLRARFHDELFVRGPGGMVPTSRAQRMIQPAADVLAQVTQEILGQPAFDPATTDTEFRLAMADVAEVIYLPRLLRHFAERAPGARVRTHSLPTEALQQAMSAGEIDLAVGYFPDLDKQSFFHQQLYGHTYACIARDGHPLCKRMTLEGYVACGHAVAASPTRSSTLLDKHLRRLGIERRVVLQTPHHLTLPAIVAETDLVATVPLAVGTRFASQGGIRLLALPFEPPRFAVQQHWHRLVHQDPRQQWLRAQVAELFISASSEWSDVDQALYGAQARREGRPRRPPAGKRAAAP